MSDYAVSLADALSRLDVIPDYDAGSGPGPCVHTFVDGGLGLLGAHWYLTDVQAAMERWGVEESGPAATATGHGLVVIEESERGKRPVFLATKDSGMNEIVAPHSGELLNLDATTDVLAAWVDDLKQVRQRITDTIDALGEEINQRLDGENTRTARVGGWVIEGKAPYVTDYDPVRLCAALLKLAQDGVISEGVVERTVVEPAVKDWRVDKREVAKLLRHADERVREAVAGCAVERAQKRSVSVARAAA